VETSTPTTTESRSSGASPNIEALEDATAEAFEKVYESQKHGREKTAEHEAYLAKYEERWNQLAAAIGLDSSQGVAERADFEKTYRWNFYVRDRKEGRVPGSAPAETHNVEQKQLPAALSAPVERTTQPRSEKTYKYDHRPLLKYVMRVIDDAGIELSKTERDVLTVGLLYFGEEIWPYKELWARALKKVTGRGSVSTIWYALHGRDGKPGLIGKRVLTVRSQGERTARGTTAPTIYWLNPFRFPPRDRPRP
jgi:hypothetical protein